MKLPKEIRDAVDEAQVCYIITISPNTSQAFLFGDGCIHCQEAAVIDAIGEIMLAEAESDQIPQIFTGLMETINHEHGRMN
jgi:hypothetical protein